MSNDNRRYRCNCCGEDFSHEEGLQYAKPTVYFRNGKAIKRRLFQCPMCGSPKKFCDMYRG